MIEVTHVITGLEQGGAETVLLRLLERSDPQRFRMRVISLSARGRLSSRVEMLGIPLRHLGLKGLGDTPAAIFRCAAALRHDPPHVIQTWMYHGDLIGGIAGRLARIPAVAWGLHAGTLPPPENRSARMGIKMAARLSSVVPARIVCCSHSAREIHATAGYSRSKMVVIENGFELAEVSPADAMSIRNQLGADPETLIVTRVGRFHPQKDYASFIAACVQVHSQHPGAIFVMVGLDVVPQNQELMREIRAAGIEEHVRLLGLRDDVLSIYGASDVAVSSSGFGEALPLALGEAMGAGVPIVTTDVGDSALLVADPSRVTPPGDPSALADAIGRILNLPREERHELGRRDRQRIGDRYSLSTMAQRYLALYKELASEGNKSL